MRFEIRHEGQSTRSGQSQTFDEDHVLIGRSRQCQIAFDPAADSEVSGKHGEFLWVAGRLTYRDLGSTNGSFLNGAPLTGTVHLNTGDVLQLGKTGPQVRMSLVEGSHPAENIDATIPAQLMAETIPGRVRPPAEPQPAPSVAAPTQIVIKKGGGGAGWFVAFVALAGLGALGYFAREELNTIRAQANEEIESAKADAELELESVKQEIDRRTDEARIAGDLLSQIDLAPLLAQGLGDDHIAEFQALEERYRGIVDQARGVSADASLATDEKEAKLKALQAKLNGAASELAKLQERARTEQQERTLEEAGRPSDWSQFASAYGESIFLVVIMYFDADKRRVGYGTGTGFVVDASGVLGTNAHVAKPLTAPLPKGVASRAIAVIQNGTGLIFDITKVLEHPEYEGVNSPDVALIWFDPKHEVQGEISLKPLPIADGDALAELAVGQHLGTIGFPGELQGSYLSVIDGDEMVAPRTVAYFKDGWITRLTTFGGTAGKGPEERFLVHHSASTSGGTSGSPMFDAQGRVIALNNAGMDLDEEKVGLRTPSASELAQAVRADLLQGLIDEHVK